MSVPSETELRDLRTTWTDLRVRIRPDSRPELTRFAGKVGRVVTINTTGRAIVDFGDGAWYDLQDWESVLEVVTDPAEIAQYNTTNNSAQANPTRQS